MELVVHLCTWVPSGCSGFLSHSNDIQIRLTGDSKLCELSAQDSGDTTVKNSLIILSDWGGFGFTMQEAQRVLQMFMDCFSFAAVTH